ncbi:MAG: hypothetical protein KKF98_02270 [Bacteroidetes bacterium]|nr:hypothetical protein [Bacteroidota bacterium]
MKFLNLFSFLMSLILFSGCNSDKKQNLSLVMNQKTQLTNISSASASGVYDDHIYLAGDDVSWLYSLSPELQKTDSIRLSSLDSLVNGRTPGKIKADFEAMEFFDLQHEKVALVVSSGSKKITRDTAYLVSLATKEVIKKKSLRPFFDQIITQTKMKAEELNIEGLAADATTLYFFQRGNINSNVMIRVQRDNFFDFFLNNAPTPEISWNNFDLPTFDGVASGFSGACMLPDESGILFTASLENTGSATADGEVLGSYIGFIPTCAECSNKISIAPIQLNEKLVQTKAESIAIKKHIGNKSYEAVVACDNDDGTSEILHITLHLN